MVRIIVTSDTHLGITDYPRIQRLVSDIKALKPDAVAIAGDIGEGADNVAVVLEDFRRLGVPIAACAGNHDVWNHDKRHPSRLMWEQILPSIAESTGTIWLDNTYLIIGEVAIVGSTAWYDYSAQEPAFKTSREETWHRKRECDADAWMVDWPWDDVEFSSIIEPGFRNRLQIAESDPKVKSIIVVTHSPILEQQMTRKPGNVSWGFSNAYYGNLTFGAIMLQFSKVTHAVAGHTHSGEDGIVEHQGRSIRAITLNSQYGNPTFVVIDT
jgi:predicted phosphohydrolase